MHCKYGGGPEVLRVTPACKAFQEFGAALRPRQRGPFYQKSRNYLEPLLAWRAVEKS